MTSNLEDQRGSSLSSGTPSKTFDTAIGNLCRLMDVSRSAAWQLFGVIAADKGYSEAIRLCNSLDWACDLLRATC